MNLKQHQANLEAVRKTDKPILLDLFCGGGGATRGYQDAGFFVLGVDIEPQPNYCGDMFWLGDAMEILRHYVLVMSVTGKVPFDALHASPPCQYYSLMSQCRPGLAEKLTRHRHCRTRLPVTRLRCWEHVSPIMGIDWMTRDQLTESIPPYYAEFVGTAMLNFLKHPSRTTDELAS